MLVWAGAPVPVFRPSREDEAKMRGSSCRHPRSSACSTPRSARCIAITRRRSSIDDRVAFVGGIDLTAKAGDRYDTNEHQPRGGIGWHDACARIEGPAVADVAEHFTMRWREVTGETARPRTRFSGGPAGDVDLQVVRTVPEKIYSAVPRGDFSILETYVRALRAERNGSSTSRTSSSGLRRSKPCSTTRS